MGFQTYIKSCCSNNDTNQQHSIRKKCCILSDKLLQNKKQIIDYFNKPPYKDTSTASSDIQKIAYMQQSHTKKLQSNQTTNTKMHKLYYWWLFAKDVEEMEGTGVGKKCKIYISKNFNKCRWRPSGVSLIYRSSKLKKSHIHKQMNWFNGCHRLRLKAITDSKTDTERQKTDSTICIVNSVHYWWWLKNNNHS